MGSCMAECPNYCQVAGNRKGISARNFAWQMLQQQACHQGGRVVCAERQLYQRHFKHNFDIHVVVFKYCLFYELVFCTKAVALDGRIEPRPGCQLGGSLPPAQAGRRRRCRPGAHRLPVPHGPAHRSARQALHGTVAGGPTRPLQIHALGAGARAQDAQACRNA